MTAGRTWPRALAVCALLTGLAAGAGAQSAADKGAPDDDVPRDGPRLHLDERGRPTLQLPFGEVVFRGRAATVMQSPSRDRGTEGPDPAWQTRRVQIEGTLFKKVEFEVSREFGDADEPERDVFANVRVSRGFELRAGQFKMPFGRDALIGGANLDFIFRSLPGRLIAPGRDIGVMAHGRLKSRRLTYQAGVFRGDGDNARTSQTRGGSRAVAGRLLVTPFVRSRNPALAAFQVGGAVVTSQLDDQLGLRGRTVFGEGVFFDRAFVEGRRLRRGLEASWAHGPASLSWEYMRVSDERLGMSASGDALPSIVATGWYVAGTWVVTGERKDGRVDPEHSVFRNGFGALELVARVEKLSFTPGSMPVPDPLAVTPDANADRVTTLGLSWYLNRYLKINGSAVFESIRDPERSPVAHDGRVPTAVIQLQAAI